MHFYAWKSFIFVGNGFGLLQCDWFLICWIYELSLNNELAKRERFVVVREVYTVNGEGSPKSGCLHRNTHTKQLCKIINCRCSVTGLYY